MVKATVTEIYDLSTKTGEGTVLKIHTPLGQNIKRHLVGHFIQYKRYRYVGAKVNLIPASTLPADPLQLSYEAGETTIDPRDMVNPILWKHFHGEAMISDMLAEENRYDYSMGGELGEGHASGIPASLQEFGTSIFAYPYSQVAGTPGDFVYATSLMDNSFRKASVQTGFSTFCKPFAYNVASSYQISANSVHGSPGTDLSGWDNTGSRSQMYQVPTDPGTDPDNLARGAMYGPVNLAGGQVPAGSGTSADDANYSNPGSLFTNKLTRLGWMDTTQNGFVVDTHVGSQVLSTQGLPTPASGAFFNANLPAVQMLYVMLPPAYKTEFYFRLVIKHYFEFAGFRSAFSVQSWGAYSQAGIGMITPSAANAMIADALSNMLKDSAEGPPNSVDVENGELIPMADGAGGN
uniref:Capsid protein n=1 Tax=Cygnus columbianus Smacoviridae sp. TaxID=2814973 RepID=A0A8A4XDC7_9VIRU